MTTEEIIEQKQYLTSGLAPEKYWVKDIDGNVLKTYRVGKYLITENLKTEHYNDGTPIPIIKDVEEWKKNTTGAMCYYNNNRKYKKECGALYNGYVNDKKLALTGWRIHTDEGWKELEVALGMRREDVDKDGFRGSDIGDKMREVLEVVFAGFRNPRGGFYGLDAYAVWWSSSVGSMSSWCRQLYTSYTSVCRDIYDRSNGFSVRCIRELTISELLDILFDGTSAIHVPIISDTNYAESIASVSDQQLIDELKRRGYTGKLRSY